MKVSNIFKRYDIRGKYPKEIDEDIAYNIGRAAGTYASRNFNKNRIVLGYDNRDSSPQLKKKFTEGVISSGIDVLDIGFSTSDMAAYAGKHFNVAFSVCITASHLGWKNNGFKFRHRKGNGFLNRDLNKLKNIYINNDFVNSRGKVKQRDFLDTYRRVLTGKFNDFNRTVNGKVAFDSGGGPSSLIVPDILENLGVDVIEINNFNEKGRDPNPREENLGELEKMVKDGECKLGLANDVDGDRLSILDERGNFVSGNQMIPIFASIFENNTNVVTTIDAGRVVTESLDNLHVCRVGDPFVSEEMLRKNAIFAAEPSGHYNYLPLCAHSSGSFFGLLASSIPGKIHEKIKQLPKYHTEKVNIEVENKDEVISKVKSWVKNNFNVLSDIDGIKFKTDGTHILVRASGTEDLIRIKGESKGRNGAEKAIKNVQDYIRSELK